jgi:tetratricopeptide (TPR) repeat protein
VFPRAALIELSPAPVRPELGIHLESLVRKELLEPDEDRELGRAFRFHHVLIRDAAYRSMLKETRAELHERMAAFLEANSKFEGESDELIGYHLEQAYRCRERLGPLGPGARELASKGGRRLAAAGIRALGRSDIPAASSLLERAVALLPADDDMWPSVALRLSSAQLEALEIARAEQTLESALQAAGDDPVLRAHAAIQRCHIQLFSGHSIPSDDMTNISEEAIRVFEQAEDDLGLARAWRVWSVGPWRRGRMTDVTIGLARSFDHAQASGDAREEAEAFQWLLIAHYQGATTADEGIELCEAFEGRGEHDRSGYAGLLHVRGAFEAMRGNVEEARSLYGRGRETYQELGLRHRAATAAVIAGDIEMNIGDPAQAEALLRPSLKVLLDMDDTTFAAETAALLTGALLTQGKVEEAAETARVSERTATPGDVFQAGVSRLVNGLVLVAQGDGESAERLTREAHEILSGTEAPNYRGDAAVALAGVLLAQGKSQDARAALEDAAVAYDQKGNSLAASRAREMLGAVAV